MAHIQAIWLTVVLTDAESHTRQVALICDLAATWLAGHSECASFECTVGVHLGAYYVPKHTI